LGLKAKVTPKLAHRAVEELNATITAQWRQIDLLTRKLEQMEQQVRSGVHIADPATEPPPPHY
jgi:SlyX protein